MKTKKNQIWNFNNEIDAEVCGEGVKRKILAYADEMMCVENHFEKGAIGALHHHPHTQITYVVSGQFEFTINGEKKIVNPGDALLKRDSIDVSGPTARWGAALPGLLRSDSADSGH